MDRRLAGLQSRSEHCGEVKNLFPLSGIEPQLSSLYSITILTKLFWLVCV
jgi:hypothetical protein